jgi:hypothetical protein
MYKWLENFQLSYVRPRQGRAPRQGLQNTRQQLLTVHIDCPGDNISILSPGQGLRTRAKRTTTGAHGTPISSGALA